MTSFRSSGTPDTPLAAVVTSLLRHRALVVEMTLREIQLRFRTSAVGVAWALLQPLAMLAIFAFVFGAILKVKWSNAGSTTEFALVLFAGLLVFNLFAECLQQAPTLIVSRSTLVKRVAFPLEVLPWVQVGHALFAFATGTVVLLAFALLVRRSIPPTVILLPLVILPVVLAGLAAGWLLGALGVFVRDLQQIVAPLSMALLFLTPVFFDLSIVPETFRPWFYANPLTFAVEQSRAILLDGQLPDFAGLAIGTLVSWLAAAASLALFRRAREEFADAL
jgi:lipopolysaccharide transport system permease protein